METYCLPSRLLNTFYLKVTVLFNTLTIYNITNVIWTGHSFEFPQHNGGGCIGNFYTYDVKNLPLFISCIFSDHHKMGISLSQYANIDVVCSEIAYSPAVIMLQNHYI